MPFFNHQDRAGLRRLYTEAWRKRRRSLPLEPLEHQVATVIEEHPEYQALLEDADAAMASDYTPEGSRSNPFLHMGLHLAVRDQVGTNRPAGIAALHGDLCRRLGSAHEAEHRMIECLAEALWHSQRTGLPPDEIAYLECLRALQAARR